MFTTQTKAPKKSSRCFVKNKKQIRQNPISSTNDTESFAKLVEAAELCRIREESTVDAVKKLNFDNNNRTKQNLPTKIIRRVPPPTKTSDPLYIHHMKFFQGVPPPTKTSDPLHNHINFNFQGNQTNHNSNSNSPALPSLASLQSEFFVNITTNPNISHAQSTPYQQKTKIDSRLVQDYKKNNPIQKR